MTSILPEFEKFPNEAAIIGRLIAGYGKLEFELCDCLSTVLESSEIAVRMLFRVKSEASRIDIADAILRPKFAHYNQEQAYLTAYTALTWCKKIRNQYAHSTWKARSSLYFTDFDSPAKAKAGDLQFEIRGIDVPTLEQQENYFFFTQEYLTYITRLYQRQTGGFSPGDEALKPPAQVTQPIPYKLLGK